MSQSKKFAILRIAFGLIWAVDAYFKWQPAFFANFVSYLTGNLDGQSEIVKQWIGIWVHLVGVNPGFFALVVALGETAIAIGLIFGLFTRIALWGGIAMSIVIWATAEGFGGPYMSGSTDIGAAIIYALLCVALLIGRSWEELSVDNLLSKKS